jgi:Ca2+-binding EF-hand superfamily protein
LTTGQSYLPHPIYQMQSSTDQDNPSEAFLKEMFGQMDIDGDGAVVLDEAQRVCMMAWPYLDPRSSSVAFTAADANGDGEISFDEFQALIRCLYFLNRHRHNVDEIEENFSDGIGLDEFQLACNVMQVVSLSDKQRKAKFEVLCARVSQGCSALTVDQFISWSV